MPFDTPPAALFSFAVGNFPLGADSWSATPRRDATGQEAWAADALTPNLRTDAQPMAEFMARIQEWHQHRLSFESAGQFGDASDGDQTEVGNRTLARVHYYDNWTIDSGFIVTTAGYPVFVRGVLTIDGAGSAIEWNGNDGVVDAGGAALTSTVLSGGAVGGDGTFAAVTNGGDSTNTAATGAGGDGGAGDDPPGTGGVATLADADARSLDVAMRGATIRTGTLLALTAGAGGGGGGRGLNAGVHGGGGGGGGGHILICARSIVLTSGGTITALGGDGDAGTADAAQAGGGGGGGQGGLIYVVYREHDITGGVLDATSVAGGAAGAAGIGTPNGTIGNVGGAGVLISIPG